MKQCFNFNNFSLASTTFRSFGLVFFTNVTSPVAGATKLPITLPAKIPPAGVPRHCRVTLALMPAELVRVSVLLRTVSTLVKLFFLVFAQARFYMSRKPVFSPSNMGTVWTLQPCIDFMLLCHVFLHSTFSICPVWSAVRAICTVWYTAVSVKDV